MSKKVEDREITVVGDSYCRLGGKEKCASNSVLLLILLTSTLAAEVSPPAQSRRELKPNIIIILADDLGYGDLGCYGQKKIFTPHLDQMAAEGMRFTQHYAGAPLCAPSRCVLMTGRHTGHASIRDNAGPQTLRADEPILPEVMRTAGYATYATGKWGLGAVGSTGDPLRRGWEGFLGFYSQIQAHSHWPDAWVKDGKPEPIAENAAGAHGVYAPDLMVEAADTYIRANKHRPFLLYVATTLPHAELSAPIDAMKPYTGKFLEKPYTAGGGYPDCEAPNATRAAMISRLDAHVGRLRATLAELQLTNRTLIVFLADNGAAVAGGSDPKFFNSSGPLKGIKFSLEEGGIRVPAIACWPGTVKPGIVDRLSAFEDWLPTCAALAGVPAPTGIDGIPLAPTLTGINAHAQQDKSHLYWEYNGNQAVRVGNLKAIRAVGTGVVRLYDLAVDIGEKNDVSSARPEDVLRLTAMMDASHVEDDAYPLAGRKRDKKP